MQVGEDMHKTSQGIAEFRDREDGQLLNTRELEHDIVKPETPQAQRGERVAELRENEWEFNRVAVRTICCRLDRKGGDGGMKTLQNL